MSFAQLPSSPGFQAPQAPDWTRFALQANENIMKGGEMRMQAGKELSDSISKAADQISGILQYNSPLERAKRRLGMVQTQAMEQMYNDYQLHPEKYLMTAHGPVMRDPFQQQLVTQHLRQAAYGAANQENTYNTNQRLNSVRAGLDDLIKHTAGLDYSNLPSGAQQDPNRVITSDASQPQDPSPAAQVMTDTSGVAPSVPAYQSPE